jgi:hypothetical protein
VGEQTLANQMWDNLQTDFTENWLQRCQYLAATAKQSRFKDAALAAQEQASAEEEGEMQAMMFALLQDQHKLQLEAMATENKATMDAMMECMSTILGGGSSGGSRTSDWNKENLPPVTNANREGDGEAKTVQCKKKCCPTATSSFSTNPKDAMSWKQTRTSNG